MAAQPTAPEPTASAPAGAAQQQEQAEVPAAVEAEVQKYVACEDCDEDVPIGDAQMLNGDGDKEQADRFRCNGCNRVRSRLHRLSTGKRGTASLKTGFNGMAWENRATFLKGARHLMGSDLKMRLTEAIQSSNTSSTETAVVQQGPFLDEQDLTNKYKNKPEQLANIFNTAATMVHPTRKASRRSQMWRGMLEVVWLAWRW